jgi:hypothetical protein
MYKLKTFATFLHFQLNTLQGFLIPKTYVVWAVVHYIFKKKKILFQNLFNIGLKTRFLVARLEGFEPPADGSEVSLLEFFKKILATAIYPINALIIAISKLFILVFFSKIL